MKLDISIRVCIVPDNNNEEYQNYTREIIDITHGCNENVNFTSLNNLEKIAKDIERDPEMIITFLVDKLSTQIVPNNITTIQGKHSFTTMEKLIKEFIKIYVMCPTCNNPGTYYYLENKSNVNPDNMFMECTACNGSCILTQKDNVDPILAKAKYCIPRRVKQIAIKPQYSQTYSYNYNQNYSPNYTSTYTHDYANSHFSNYTHGYANSHNQNYNTNYTSTYTHDYANRYTSNYNHEYAQNYTHTSYYTSTPTPDPTAEPTTDPTQMQWHVDTAREAMVKRHIQKKKRASSIDNNQDPTEEIVSTLKGCILDNQADSNYLSILVKLKQEGTSFELISKILLLLIFKISDATTQNKSNKDKIKALLLEIEDKKNFFKMCVNLFSQSDVENELDVTERHMVKLLRIVENILFTKEYITRSSSGTVDIFYTFYETDIVTEEAIRSWFSTILPKLNKVKQTRIRVVLKKTLMRWFDDANYDDAQDETQYDDAQRDAIQYDDAQRDSVQYDDAQYGDNQYDETQYRANQYDDSQS